jgi:MoaA/NifB/PqqE/SkfB family radical SAM enzyme
MRRRWMTLGWKVWQSNIGALRSPYKLTYAVTTRCNSRCRHCLVWQQKPANELSMDEIARFARASPHWSWIDFTGGEPTLRDDFVEVVRVFLVNNPNLVFIHFPTNGLQTDRVVDACQRLLTLSPPRLVVTVSIDGPPAVHDTIRGVKGGFDRACRTLAELSRIKELAVHAGLTLCPENLGEIDNTVAALKDAVPGFTARRLHVNIPHISSHFYHNLGVSPEATGEMVEAIRRFMKTRGAPRSPFEWVEWMYQKRVASYVRSGKCPQECAALLASCFLGSSGDVYPCSMWDARVGNIRDTDFQLRPLLTQQISRELRLKLLRKDCPNCWTPCEAYQTLAANFLRVGPGAGGCHSKPG